MRRAARRGAYVGIIGLAAALALTGCGGGSSPTAAATATATYIPIPTNSPTQTSAPNPWKAVTNLNTVANIAPAHFRTQFKAFAGVTSKTAPPELWVKRSDDYGVTFHKVSLPAIPGGTNPTNVQILTGEQSPLDPMVYFLIAQTQQRCANGELCQYQFVTMNGGASWSALNLPVHGILGVPNALNNSAAAQSHRLYGVVTDVVIASSGVTPPGRLVASDDGGQTWSLDDAGIFAAHLWIYGFAASPDGSTVVAIAGQNFGSGMPPQTPTYSVWRSADSGATWKNMGQPPAKNSPTVIVAPIPQTGKTAIYLLGGDSNNALRVYASLDGGATWPDSYTFPISTDSSGPGVTLVGSLASGAVAIASYDNSTLSWIPGDKTPTTIFPGPLGVTYYQSELLTPPNSLGVYYVWISAQDANGNLTYYYASAQ